MMDIYDVHKINRKDCEKYILTIHYAKRWPSISYAYGLFLNRNEGDWFALLPELVGVITYGTPSSPTLRNGIAGDEMSENVLELNRLCLKNNLKNEASILVGRSLKLLGNEKNAIIISFADTSQNHLGIVYQATNFIYCGLSAKRTDWKIKGKENLHGQTISDKFRGVENRSKLIREKYGDDFYLEPRPRKHRYITFVGNKRFKKKAMKSLKYDILPYPKGEYTNAKKKNDPYR